MAIHTFITPDMGFETPRETPKSRAFPDLLGSLFSFVVAERDLDDVCYSQDPAYSAWMQEAELAQERLTESLRAFHSLPHAILQDRPLQRFALLIDAMLGHEEPGGARRLHRQMQFAFFSKFQVPGIGATAMQRNAMLIQARQLTTALAALPLFDSAPEVIDDAVEMAEAQTATL